MLPSHGRHVGDGIGQGLPLGRRGLKQLLVQVQAVPAHNHILHALLARVGHLLFFLADVAKLPVLPIEYGAGELVRAFELVQLVVDALAQVLLEKKSP